MFICEKCGCNDPKYFGIRNNKPYCRRCISFSGTKAIQYSLDINADLKENLSFPLSVEQEEISLKTKEANANNQNVLIYAVCGAGKTEIVYRTIAYNLSLGKQVGFCIPRKDVVIELLPRIQKAFPKTKVIAVYGGNTKVLEGEIILLTTHQLYRYKNYFDLLIIDETDAFPFSNNEVLMEMFNSSIRGNYIMMSATPLNWMIKKIKKENGVYLKLMKRYHGHPLIVPQIKIIPFLKFLYIAYKINSYHKQNYPCFIFCPTIDECELLFKLLKPICLGKGNFVHSKRDNRDTIISNFKNGTFQYLVTTSVLERGVTVKNIQVIICNADSEIYNEGTLIQIAGRVGRKIDAYRGEVIYVCDHITPDIESSINKIKEANSYVDV